MFEENLYVYVKELLTKNEVKLLETHIKEVLSHNLFPKTRYKGLNDIEHIDYKILDDKKINTIGLLIKPMIEEICNDELISTYTFARMYKKGMDLIIHRDRHLCEISASCTISVDDEKNVNELYVNKERPKDENDGKRIKIGIGDAVIYKGMELWHWRKRIDNEWLIQIFFHYVKKNGEFANVDKRSDIIKYNVL